MKAMLRTVALAAVFALTFLATGHAVSDVGTCNIYCYDASGNLYYYGQTTSDDFSGCCSSVADLCPGGHGRGYFSAKYYFFQGVC